jgi:tRNA nucleotidyltransferase (CCA-adding enzyme)
MPATKIPPNAEELLNRLQPPQRRVLEVVRKLAARPPARVYLVGGPVRDLLMDQPAHDLDFVVEGDGPAFAARLARRLQGSLQVFERFGTAVVGVRGVGHVDVASARSEEYPEPGALPNVAVPAPLEQDLRRRDFTINALAIGVGPQEWGRLYDPLGGQRDLRARRLRIVHARSFRDDPNRLIRAAGFAGRFGLALEPRTERRLREAVAAGVLRTISADRRNETLRRLLRQPGAPLALALLSEWGLLEPLGLGRPLKSTDHRRLSRVPAALAALAAPTEGPEAMAAYVALLLSRRGVDAETGAQELGLSRRARRETLQAVVVLRQPPAVLRETQARPARLFVELRGLGVGTLAALWTIVDATARRRLEDYWQRLRHVQPDLTGEDLARAGLRGAEIAAGLERARVLKLDHPEATQEAQLATALADQKST